MSDVRAISLTDRATDLGFGLGWSAVRAMPDSVVDRVFRAAADRTWRKQGPSVRQLTANLSRVLPSQRLPELPDIAHEGVRRYLRYWSEVFRLPGWSQQRVNETFDLVEGVERLDDAMNAGNGAVMAITHSGNWDLAGAWGCHRYGGLVTVAERLKPESLFDRFVAYRESLGMEVLPLGDSDVLRVLARRLREGRLVCLLADRDLAHSGVPVDFFGERASMPAGPAALADLTGAPLLPVSIWYDGERTLGKIGEPLQSASLGAEGNRSERISETTQAMADAFALEIAKHPQDWHMMQRLWHADLDGDGR